MIRSLAGDGRLQEARRIGEEAVAADPHDDDAISALAGVYIDIEARCIESGVTAYLPEISARIDELLSSLVRDDGGLRQRHTRLMLTTLPGYSEIHGLELMSARGGSEREAYIQARRLVTGGGIAPALLEIYATILYRWARVAMTDMESRPLREVLFEYLGLPIPRPSRLHSLVLRLAVRAARKYPDFNFTRFFDLWNPRMMRDEDIVDPERKYSLAAAAFELVIDSADAYRFPELLDRVKASAERRMAVLREAFDTLVTRQIQAGDNPRAIDLLRLYASHPAIHAADRFHSRLLASALRVMDGGEMWRFVEFFVQWDPSLFREADYLPAAGKSTVPLVSRALNRAFAAVKADHDRHAHILARFLAAYDSVVAASPFPADELSVRRRALLMSWMERDNEAVVRMSAMAEMGHRSPAFWLDFADIVPSRETKLGLLALGALQIDDLGSDVPSDDPDVIRLRLSLARLLHICGDDDGAATELQLSAAVAEPLARYGAIKSTLDPASSPNYSNLLLYHRLAADALDVIYCSVKSETMTVLSVGDRSVYLVSDSALPVAVDTVLWPLLAALHPGDAVEVKRNDTGVVMARPLELAPYAALTGLYGIVIGSNRVQCGGRAAPVDCDDPVPFECGSAVGLNIYLDAESRTRGINIVSALRNEVLPLFDSTVAVVAVDSGNACVLTAGPDGPDFTLENSLQLPLGTVCRISYYTDRHGRAIPLDCRPLPSGTPCEAVMTVSGRLDIHPDGSSTVRRVSVPETLAGTVPPSTYVTALAIYNPAGRVWQALSLSPYTS